MFDFGQTYEKDMRAQAMSLDRADTSAAALLVEFFPDTTNELLARWEARFKIVPPDGATTAERQAAIAAHERDGRALNLAYFEAIAEDLGYTIGPAGSTDPHCRFVDGQYGPFRADYGRADIDAVYDQESGANMLTVTVYGTDVESDTSLHTIMAVRKVAGTEIVYTNE